MNDVKNEASSSVTAGGVTMEPFTVCIGIAAAILRPNIDTDAIIPSREMKRVSKAGLGEGLFADERYVAGDDRKANPEFILNRAEYAHCSILLAGANFGCGSSREHAVWALKEFGIRAIVAPSFGSIFANNCVRNGLLAVPLAMPFIEEIAAWVSSDPAQNRVRVDLERQCIEAGDHVRDFLIDPGARQMLLEGLDAIALTLARWEVISDFDAARRESRPWLYSL
ncbi:MAG: 3-isopropylmalate dehydratase small subunit [Congregibacter sp.]